MVNISLALVFGIPASGKTFLCKYLLSSKLDNDQAACIASDKCKLESAENETCFLPGNDQSSISSVNFGTVFVHVCYDRIIPIETQAEFVNDAKYRCHGDETLSWKTTRNRILTQVENFLTDVKYSAGNDIHDVISASCFPSNIEQLNGKIISAIVILLDDNFYYRSMRRPYYLMAAKYKTGFCEIFNDCDVTVAAEWNDLRADTERIPEKTILKMAELIEPPSSETLWEHLSVITKIQRTTDVINISEILSVINKSLYVPIDRTEWEEHETLRAAMAANSRQQCSRSLKHQVDLMLRKFVTKVIEENKNGDSSVVSSKARLAHKEILKEIKLGILLIPASVAESSSDEDKAALQDFLWKTFSDTIRFL